MAIIFPIADIFIHVTLSVCVVGVCRLLPVPDVTTTVPVAVCELPSFVVFLLNLMSWSTLVYDNR